MLPARCFFCFLLRAFFRCILSRPPAETLLPLPSVSRAVDGWRTTRGSLNLNTRRHERGIATRQGAGRLEPPSVVAWKPQERQPLCVRTRPGCERRWDLEVRPSQVSQYTTPSPAFHPSKPWRGLPLRPHFAAQAGGRQGKKLRRTTCQTTGGSTPKQGRRFGAQARALRARTGRKKKKKKKKER